ncbi:putative S-adenosyl-L-methionine-dependent methyltransferase [Heracleum sosnowskyi]|uniref:S-adenosyl-L-methionine-dependent methyltransferase n=1 Tax=Heracleum sosnowskyi TaxID=360622 RepID=A0AAD8ILH5_9APIA|nr:putative S-adenosyl-L-methionine-dependent methyltransferase [Heracleum sosnowskyi]
MEWSAQDATNAYLNTLDLCKVKNQKCNLENTEPLIEPECMELISALAAGSKAKLLVEITTQGISSLTIPLAVAAKQTGGKVICLVPRRENTKKIIEKQLKSYDNIIVDLKKVMRFVIGDPCEAIKHYKKIDFAVIDGNFEDHSRLFKCIDMNSKGSVVVVNSTLCKRTFGEVVKGNGGAASVVTLPIGQGMELTRIGSSAGRCKFGKSRRFYVVDERRSC